MEHVPKTHVDLHAPHHGKAFLFSYGSNNPHQTAERLEISYEKLIENTVACEAQDYILAFGLNSGRWEGGVANLAHKPGASCPGLAYLLENEIIDKMDKFEGGYQRKEVTLLHEGHKFKGIAYIQNKQSKEFHYPSRRYLVAIGKTLMHYYHIKKMHKNQIEIHVTDTKTLEEKGKETIKKEEIGDIHKV